ncbi:MAG: hypothetical protein HZC41_11680 [Chloroflexi bacterium]|nr:hypothetical protein [Chloroflexota bacterium]
MNLGQWLLDALWYVHPPVALAVQAAPVECLAALAVAAKPSQQRLHLRNLFTEGRRYHLQATADGFRLTSTSKIPWRRGRTTVAALLIGDFTAGNGVTRVALRARMRLPYFLDIFLIPSFITSIMVFAPWPMWLITLLALVLYGLSWTWHRLTAAMQAAEMIYFVQKALEDLTPYQTPALGQSAPDVVDFRDEWERFFNQRKHNDSVDEPPDKGS